MPGPNVPYTALDFEQVLKQSFDEDQDRLRVDAEVTAVIGTVEVVITDTNDSIKIGNGLGVFADVDAGRNLTVIDVAANATLSSIDSQLSAGITVNAIQSGVWSTGRTWVLDNSTDSVESFQGGTWSVDVNNFPATQSVTQGTSPWIISGTVAATQSGAWTTGRTWVLDDSTDSIASVQSGTWTTGRTWTLSSGTDSVNIGNFPATQSVTQGTTPWIVDGSGFTQPVSGTVTVLQGTSPWVISGTVAATQSGTWVLGANSGVDIGDVTINNGAGAGAVNIQDGGNSITVDGTVTVLQGTSPWVVSGTVTTTTSNDTNYGVVGANTLRTAAQIGNATGAADFGAGITTAQTLRVVLPTDQTAIPVTQSGTWNIGTLSTITNVVHVDDNGGSLTVDGTVTVLQGTSPWVVSGTVTTSPDVNVHDGTGVSISSTGSSLDVNVTNTIPVSQSGAWTVAATQSGAWTTGRTWTLSSGTDSVASVQSGAWTVTALQGTSPWVISGTVAATQSGTWVLGANSGVDIGDVTINNGAGAAAVNIQDGGNSITVDGTVTVLQGTSPWVISGTVTTTNSDDHNYGVVGANTLRTAAQIGNATGAADFNAGTTTAQTLRVVLPTDQTAIPVTQSGAWTTGRTWTLSSGTDSVNIGNFPATVAVTQSTSPWVVSGTVTVNQGTSPWVISGAVTLPYDTNYGTVGANTLRTASQIGNSTGQADFNAGTTGAQTLRTTANITRNGTELDYNYGTVGANTLRTASQIGNATGAADFNAGATGAQTLRVTANAGVNLNTSALALDTTVAALQVTQGSTTAGQSGTLIQGAVTTNAPTYVTGQTSPFSLTTGGALRVDEVGFSTPSNTRPAVNNASSTILAANAGRKYVNIFNQSGSTIYIKLGAAAVINEGIRLTNNEMFEINKDNLWLGTIQAIKSGAASVNIEVFEGTL